jgi:threonine dehydrogenase-like Zn-dependent dehydrogenase
MELTGGIGADRVVEAVGVDAERPAGGPAIDRLSDEDIAEYERERARAQGLPESEAVAAPGAGGSGGPHGDYRWVPGNAPSQALRWSVEMVAKAGTIGIVGVYPPGHISFPLGTALNRNLTVRAGNCDHRRYVPGLLSRIAGGHADPTLVMTQQETIPSAIDAYEAFDRRMPGWTKVVLEVAG